MGLFLMVRANTRKASGTKKSIELNKQRAAAAKARALQAAADLAVRKSGLARIREAYVPIFGSRIDIAGIDFRAKPKDYLSEVLARQEALLPSLTDEALVALWLRFCKAQAAINAAERSSRDRKFLAALESDWRRRKLELDGQETYFRWPSTLVLEVTGDRAVEGAWPSSGMLDALGYHVGKVRGVDEPQRRRTLCFLFEEHLPLVFDTTYTTAWGAPKSSTRLRKLAETIAALVRNAKRNPGRDYSTAIEEWEQDLAFLWTRYYVGQFKFGWPGA